MSPPSPWPKRIAVAAGLGVGLLGLVVIGVYVKSESRLNRQMTLHSVDFPIPFPLTVAERDALTPPPPPPPPEGVTLADATGAAAAEPAPPPPTPAPPPDFEQIALTRAIERGEHLVKARYACGECHGADLAGGVMVDDPMVGQLFGPNLTRGKGSKTVNYTAADWDRMVRHGVRPDGGVSLMPAKDFFAMSDQELSDIAAYVGSLSPIDKENAPPKVGPLLRVLITAGQIEFSADVHPTAHEGAHLPLPPEAAPDATFGKHLATVCTGCHRADYTGGPIAGAPPDWPPAANLAKGAFKDWTYADFDASLRTGKRPDGTAFKAPMDGVAKIGANMTEVEMQAMWAFFQTIQ